VLFPDMCSEILYLFLHESSASIFEHPENLLSAANKKAFAIPVSPFVKVLKIVEFGNFVERTILHKI
jgi:hypothetical protein